MIPPFGSIGIIFVVVALLVFSRNLRSIHPSVASTPTPTITQVPTLSPITPTLTPIPQPTAQPTPLSPAKTQSWFYPGAQIQSQSGSTSIYQTTDDPNQVADWYKSQINSQHLNTKSFITTNSNGNVVNSLVGAAGNSQVTVKINKLNNENVTKITVTLTNI